MVFKLVPRNIPAGLRVEGREARRQDRGPKISLSVFIRPVTQVILRAWRSCREGPPGTRWGRVRRPVILEPPGLACEDHPTHPVLQRGHPGEAMRGTRYPCTRGCGQAATELSVPRGWLFKPAPDQDCYFTPFMRQTRALRDCCLNQDHVGNNRARIQTQV